MLSALSPSSKRNRVGAITLAITVVAAVAVFMRHGSPASEADTFSMFATNEAHDNDLSRAHEMHPRGSFMGRNRRNMVQVLNSHLLADKNLKTDECSTFTTERLNELGDSLWQLRDDRLNQVYADAKDNRQLRHTSLSKMHRAWDTEENMKKMDASLSRSLRAKKCREMVMWYVHHLTEDSRQEFKSLNLVLPLMQEEDDDVAASDDAKIDAVLSKNPRMKLKIEGDNAESQDGCVKCHVEAIEGNTPHQQSTVKYAFGTNEPVIFNPSHACKIAVMESYANHNLAVTMVDEFTYGYKTMEDVRKAFKYAFLFPVHLDAEDVGRDKQINIFQGRGNYTVDRLIGYFLKKGKERRTFHEPIYTYTSKCAQDEIVYNYKETVETHTEGGKKWACVVFTTVRAVPVNGVFKITDTNEKVGYL